MLNITHHNVGGLWRDAEVEPEVDDGEEGTTAPLLPIYDDTEGRDVAERLREKHEHCPHGMVDPAPERKVGDHIHGIEVPQTTPEGSQAEKEHQVTGIFPQDSVQLPAKAI